jgi:predicted RNA-binding Zn ribbon-like protein
MAYAEAAATIVNADLADAESVRSLLAHREWLRDQCSDRDAVTLRRLQRELRPVFEAGDAGDSQSVVAGINELLERHPITPAISDHEPEGLHIHVASKAASVADLLVSESLLGLTVLVCDLGPARLGVCSAPPCTNVYVDTSPNQSRRYCSDRCSSRANVAAYRARQRAASA